MRNLLHHVTVTGLLVVAVMGTGCAAVLMGPGLPVGAQQATPHQWHGAGGLVASQEDKDVGLVGIAPGFDIRRYATVVIDRCSVVESEIKDEGDRELARTLSTFFQAELVRRLSSIGLFDRVVIRDEAGRPVSADRALSIECVVTQLTPGSLPLRIWVDMGAGRTKAEAELRFIDVETSTVVMVTADRRVGASLEESEPLLRDSFNDMARDLAKFLVRLNRGQGPRK
jgi:hypothetical protein